MRQQQELVKYDLQMPSVIAVKDPGSSVIGVECDPLAFEPRKSVSDLNRAGFPFLPTPICHHGQTHCRWTTLPKRFGIVLLVGASGFFGSNSGCL